MFRPQRRSVSRELRADLRSAIDRRIADLEIAMVIGRTHQFGQRTEAIKEKIMRACAEHKLPWECFDD